MRLYGDLAGQFARRQDSNAQRILLITPASFNDSGVKLSPSALEQADIHDRIGLLLEQGVREAALR